MRVSYRGVVATATALLLASVLGVSLFPQSGAWAAEAAKSTAALASGPDSDGDGIPDAVERVVCGTATCATGREDSDADGIPDWVEVMACGTVTCAVPGADSDGDGIPDFAEQIVCGSAGCASGVEDSDGDGVPDWAEVVICGTVTCATGDEDFDGDGVADAVELQAHVLYVRKLASTGSELRVDVVLLVAVSLILLGALLVGVRQLRRRAVLVSALHTDEGTI